ncbi:MAG: hypothetical protein KUG75_01720 [Pseudomonadales bacterium]|nr:hypothetical protein [Pseudomonadales bacterium]
MPVPEQPGQATQKSETTNPAVLSLQNASASARASDNLPQAIAYIERALRIDAQRMGLWLELAQLHLESLNFSNAEQVARKALTFKQESSEQISIAWLIIATCLEASGDSAQAQDIRDYVVTLSAGV